MHRLVAYAPNGVQRFVVDRSEMLIGSGESCDIHLSYPGVSAEHARVYSEGARLRIEDIGARKGVLVNGKRVREAWLQVLDEIRLGSIALLVEDIAVEVAAPAPAPEPPPRPPSIDAAGMLDHLAAIARWVLSDAATSTTLESLVMEVLGDFGGGVLFLIQGPPGTQGIKFVVASEARWLVSGEELVQQVTERVPEPVPAGVADGFRGRLGESEAWIGFKSFIALDRPYLVVAAFPRFEAAADWSPVAGLATLSDLLILGLVHHVGQFEPILFGLPEQAELILAPGLVAGESRTMKRVLEALRVAVEPEVRVLLRGESGVSKELLAHSLHLSGPRRDGAFVVASCRGAKTVQLEADLFGAEIAGKRETVVREGKLSQADGGTLFLDEVELMPLELQDRLMRFLRTAEVEPAGSVRREKVDVRLIAGSRAPLESFVARDQLRIDLAYQLSQLAIDIPALRERREDLPLLIQARINRCCHETNKRVQGITVKALEALAVYDYPGNLPELENIVRRLVYLCPSGAPIDESMLPEEVRLAKIKGLRPETRTELNLENLVASCERAAIREALRRTAGNKSAAARLLGLSRNGLALKISRLELNV